MHDDRLAKCLPSKPRGSGIIEAAAASCALFFLSHSFLELAGRRTFATVVQTEREREREREREKKKGRKKKRGMEDDKESLM